MKKILFCLCTFGLFATVNEPLRIEVFSGYRNDRIHWHLHDGTSRLYRDVEYWENGLTLKVIHRDLTFFTRGSYGFKTDGWCADAAGYFGYAVNLTADRVYRVLLTPLVGYAAYFDQLASFRQVWNGFFLGGGFTFEPVGRLVLNVGYAYNFMHTRVRIPSFSMSSGGNKGHTGWAQIDGKLNRYWRIGIGGQIQYFFTRVVTSENFKLRWTPVSGWAQISREF